MQCRPCSVFVDVLMTFQVIPCLVSFELRGNLAAYWNAKMCGCTSESIHLSSSCSYSTSEKSSSHTKRPPFIPSLFPRNLTSLLFKQFSELVFVRLRSPQVSCFTGTRLAPPRCNRHGPAVSAPCCRAQNNPQRPKTRVA